MKKVLASLVLICIISFSSSAQNQKVRGKALGISFIMNDFNTAQQIRSGSIEQVFRNKSWSKMKDMSPGLGVTYFRGLHPNIDFAGTLNMSFLNYPFRNKPMGQGESLLLEADASVNLKMFTDDYWFTPYLIAGIGASMYENKYGAILPLGGGMKLNLFDEAALFITAQYRVGLTTETTNYHFVYGIGIAGTLGGGKDK